VATAIVEVSLVLVAVMMAIVEAVVFVIEETTAMMLMDNSSRTNVSLASMSSSANGSRRCTNTESCKQQKIQKTKAQ
jgi:hypothetical protein